MLIDFIAYYLFFLKGLLVFTASVIIVSSLDDLFIDVTYWVRSIRRWLFVQRKYKPLEAEQLFVPAQKLFAVMIPAWQESDVIFNMVENTLKTYDYEQYHIFVGSYQNDPQTQSEVKRLVEKYTNIHSVIVPRDGPTCKADCLNWLIQGVTLFEKQHGQQFAGIVMHDAEDVVHRLELRLFNYLVDRKDLMQLPVFSLERKWYEFTAGHYIDEFAESHSKDMLVREELTGAVPSAGVATCFSRRAIAALAAENNNTVFNTDSLTEDYDISFRLKKLGMEQIFLRYGVMTTVRKTSPFTGKVTTVRQRDYVATREYFPNSITTAKRQKARWILGIAFQGWRIIGWQGSLAARYVLFRDRKAIVTSLATFLAYFILINGVVLVVLKYFLEDYYGFPSIVEVGSLPWWFIIFNLVFLANRLFHRVLFTSRIYGWEQGLLSIPRMVVGNYVNFLATSRALRLFIGHVFWGRKLVWDKTAHAYPSAEQLQHMKQRLGEMLLERKLVTQHALTTALEQQKQHHRPLGEILLQMEAITLTDLAEALAQNLNIPVAEATLRLQKGATT